MLLRFCHGGKKNSATNTNLKNKLPIIVFILVTLFFITSWRGLIYPIFKHYGAVGNGLLVVILGILWGLCASYSMHVFIELRKSLKIILFIISPLLLILSIRLNSQASYLNIGEWLREISNWKINIFYFDWGGWLIFSSLGLFCMLVAFTSFIFVSYFNSGKTPLIKRK
jgi:hypothetical protein